MKCVQTSLNGVTDKTVLLVGAGETGNLALQNIHKKGVKQIGVTNRTIEKAEKTAAKYNGMTIAFDTFGKYLHGFDIVMIATSSATPVITAEMVKQKPIGQARTQTGLYRPFGSP